MSMTTKMLIASLPCLAWALLGCASPCREFAGAEWFRTAEVIDVPTVPSGEDADGPQRRLLNRFSVRQDDLDGVLNVPFIFDRRYGSLPVIIAHAARPDGTNHAFSLLVDTGATSDTLTLTSPLLIEGRLARQLSAKLLPGSSVYLKSDPSGRSVGADALLEEVTIGDIQITNARASVNLGRVSRGHRPDGLLALDFFRAFDAVVFDWSARRIWLGRDEWMSFDFSGWSAVPMLNTDPNGPSLVSIEARFGEHAFPALLDTGAAASGVPAPVFDLIPKSSQRPVNIATSSITIRDVKARPPHPIEIDGFTYHVRFVIRCEWATYRTDDGRPVTALIGMDVLRQRPFALDFKNNTVWFAPEGWQGPPKVAEQSTAIGGKNE